jgi:hypothetical protein
VARADVHLQRVEDQRHEGSASLLHDAGGNCEQTVEALPKLIGKHQAIIAFRS